MLTLTAGWRLSLTPSILEFEFNRQTKSGNNPTRQIKSLRSFSIAKTKTQNKNKDDALGKTHKKSCTIGSDRKYSLIHFNHSFTDCFVSLKRITNYHFCNYSQRKVSWRRRSVVLDSYWCYRASHIQDFSAIDYSNSLGYIWPGQVSCSDTGIRIGDSNEPQLGATVHHLLIFKLSNWARPLSRLINRRIMFDSSSDQHDVSFDMTYSP